MKSKRLYKPIILLSIFSLVFTGCSSQQSAWKGTIEEDDDGYNYVKRYKVTWKFN